MALVKALFALKPHPSEHGQALGGDLSQVQMITHKKIADKFHGPVAQRVKCLLYKHEFISPEPMLEPGVVPHAPLEIWEAETGEPLELLGQLAWCVQQQTGDLRSDKLGGKN